MACPDVPDRGDQPAHASPDHDNLHRFVVIDAEAARLIGWPSGLCWRYGYVRLHDSSRLSGAIPLRSPRTEQVTQSGKHSENLRFGPLDEEPRTERASYTLALLAFGLGEPASSGRVGHASVLTSIGLGVVAENRLWGA